MSTNKTYRPNTMETCHCGASFEGSDHCPHCSCEIFESYCDVDYRADKCAELSDEEIAIQFKYITAEMTKRRKI